VAFVAVGVARAIYVANAMVSSADSGRDNGSSSSSISSISSISSSKGNGNGGSGGGSGSGDDGDDGLLDGQLPITGSSSI